MSLLENSHSSHVLSFKPTAIASLQPYMERRTPLANRHLHMVHNGSIAYQFD